jgi:hypothetical protein
VKRSLGEVVPEDIAQRWIYVLDRTITRLGLKPVASQAAPKPSPKLAGVVKQQASP